MTRLWTGGRPQAREARREKNTDDLGAQEGKEGRVRSCLDAVTRCFSYGAPEEGQAMGRAQLCFRVRRSARDMEVPMQRSVPYRLSWESVRS